MHTHTTLFVDDVDVDKDVIAGGAAASPTRTGTLHPSASSPTSPATAG